MNRAEVDQHRSDVLQRLARLEEKHDAHVDMTRDIKLMLQLQNGRVAELEKKQSWFMGGLGVITFVFGSLIAWIKGGNSG
tara:strand:- start:1598 stop:1837 length:240 start_codon:yes stop_codon:yes gene_type:complete